MLVTERYRRQLEQMHAERANFGKGGSKWAPWVYKQMGELDTTSILDYGCGKGELNLHMPISIDMYDPGVPRLAELPSPADIVVCTDVLEHIEPTWLDDVLKHLHSVTKMKALLCISCRPAHKTLPDGRNAHLIVQPPEWWRGKREGVGFTVVQDHEFELPEDHPLRAEGVTVNEYLLEVTP